MTKTGKHPTNIAGDWKENDMIVVNKFDGNVSNLLEEIWRIKKMHQDGTFIMCRGKVCKKTKKYDYINITEMQRALGRV
jgi:hypothetical protein